MKLLVSRLLIVAFGVGAILVIAGTIHALTFDPFRDDVLDGSEIQTTAPVILEIICPEGFSQSHLDLFSESSFEAIPICVDNSDIFNVLGCNEEFVTEEGIVLKVICIEE